jgi:hypothetical protein
MIIHKAKNIAKNIIILFGGFDIFEGFPEELSGEEFSVPEEVFLSESSSAGRKWTPPQ